MSDTNWPVLSQKKLEILNVHVIILELYYPYNKNKGADQLCSYPQSMF